MVRPVHALGVACGVFLLAVVCLGPSAFAQQPPTLEQLLERIAKLEAEVQRLKDKPAPAEADRLFALIETPYLGPYYQSRGPAAYFVAKLILVNMLDEPVRLTRDDIQLEIDGQARPLDDVPNALRSQSISIGTQHQPLRNLQPAKELRIPAGGTASTWMVFGDIAAGGRVPSLVLKLKYDGRTHEIDVNEQQRAALGLGVERIGPRGSLALLTISGSLNGINAQSLVDELERLAADHIVRVVVRFSESSAPLTPQTLNWLQQTAISQGRSRFVGYPSIPASLREFHLAELPQSGPGAVSGRGFEGRIHRTTREAVSAALRTVYEMLSREELLREIQDGHVLTRAAALAHGGGRLGTERLPLILEYAEHDDPQLQLAALQALRHFGEPRAIETLREHATRNVEPLASQAIESLAGSRFSAAHAELLKLLREEQPAVKKTIVQVLAKYPRPLWSETLYEFASDRREGLNAEAIKALVKVGHPNLVDVLEQSLHGTDKDLRNYALSVLVTRTDERSERLAMEHALEHLKTAPPDGQIITLLTRTRDPRAVPLLLSHLEKASDKVAIINLLAQLGDQTMADTLAARYPSHQPHEKAAILNGLRQLHSPKFRELAGPALLSNESVLVSAAAQGLQADGSPEAVRLLVSALEKANQNSAWSYICNALGQIGTAEARAALLKARENSDPGKRNQAVMALQNLRQRSPGYQYVWQGQAELQQKNLKQAREQFEMAIQLDPDLPEGYVGRGNVLLKEENYADAGRDFAKAVELDPHNGLAITGHAVCLVMQGKIDDGLQVVEKSRERFQGDLIYRYNTACVYARAAEQIEKRGPEDKRDQQRQQYRKTAVEELTQAVKLGFEDFSLLKDDPDLQSIRDTEEYQKLVGEAPRE